MIYAASYVPNKGWRVIADYTANGGARIDICGAVSEAAARETASLMNLARASK